MIEFRLTKVIYPKPCELGVIYTVKTKMDKGNSSSRATATTVSNNRVTLLNNHLAKLVAYLTIISTAILIPNTIATILGNSMWTLGPEFLPAYLVPHD
ncbi:MAG: hypothetical protein WC046_01150 [Candidatus Bathyarchaeia archaeon]